MTGHQACDRVLADCSPEARDTARRAGCACAESTKIKRNVRHDAFFCTGCGAWLETACTDPECYFCPERPQCAPLE